MPRTSTVDPDSFRRSTRDRLIAKLVVVRAFAAPILSTFALLFLFFEPTAWRRAVLIAVVCTLVSLSLFEWMRFRQRGVTSFGIGLNFLTMVAAHLCIMSATGGLFSPFVPPAILMALVSGLMLERRLLLVAVGAMQIPAFWTMAIVHTQGWPVPTLIPTIFGSAGALENGIAPWVAATVYTLMVAGGSRVGIELRLIYQRLFDEALTERDRSLALHAEQSRALTTLSGEIAHELKNPLASVKGLAALVSKDAEGKSAERLTVLRREVDRMQSILEEFLNFSRPLVPLALSEVELGQLARDVARLHEGTATERSVLIHVESKRAVWLRCDPRKVRQVLINLVQNAIDASPRNSVLDLRVSRDGEGGRIVVEDRGAGIDEDIAERVFEAGVTTKEHGSGLGLAVARSLARQHGGTLALENRDDGGCAATLWLPLSPPEASA